MLRTAMPSAVSAVLTTATPHWACSAFPKSPPNAPMGGASSSYMKPRRLAWSARRPRVTVGRSHTIMKLKMIAIIPC